MRNRKLRHRKRANFSILFVSDKTERIRTIRTTSDRIILITILCGLLLAAVIGYVIHGVFVRDAYDEQIGALHEEIATLSEDKILLSAEIESLEAELKEANNRISEKESQAQAKTEAEALQYMPSALPLDSQALPSEYDKEKKWITMDAAPGVHVVAAGSGTVSYAGESVESGGYLVSVDHGNGYQTDYYCQSRPVVKERADVRRGTVLFSIGDEGDKLFYRVKYEGDFIDPYTVLNIAG
ncbi:MAG: peptidoglycan DD-metalloendopeptidase family protein [Lachnospiraceae bacterium]|nr:peptidoglycan DD-metalloendopeptidase family protein [Lachnospiraceae bacterium]